MAETAIVRAIEGQSFIDRGADLVQGAVKPLLSRAPLLERALHGEWLGHPLHAAMTDLPVGAWSAGFVMDLAEVFGGSRRLRRGADAAHKIGLVGAMSAAIAGLADYSRTEGEAKRVGFVHATTNTVVAGLYGASLYARSRRRRRLGIALSSAGYGLLLFSAWLGGHLSYRLGVGVRRDAPRTQESERGRWGEGLGEGLGGEDEAEAAEQAVGSSV